VVLESVAASSDHNLIVMPSPTKPTVLRRLPADYMAGASSSPLLTAEWVGEQGPRITGLGSEAASTSLYARHQGGLLSRALGTAVHSLLEDFARLRTTLDSESACAALSLQQPRIAARIRASGLDEAQASHLAARALQQALDSAADPLGAWILSPQAEAASELRWTGVIAGALCNVRIDRIFRAGAAPLEKDEDHWWIVDYKTAHEESADPGATLAALRPLFAPQLAAYAAVLRALHGPDAQVCAGLYYPRMLQFDWWEI
jgi:ATP-dependent exoDNAse (exonuclease V) beta subunit